MANIQFNYLYRDAGNYKKYGSVTFANPNNISFAELSTLIQSKLIDQTWFYHNHWRLPDLRETFDPEIDPTWHEFENVVYTDDRADIKNKLSDFIGLVKNTDNAY
jgi:hypothetical protein